jgi:hypothetical protein
MARSTASPLDRQLARVRRRLFAQTLLTALVRGWVLALALSAAWFLAQPYLLREAAPWLRWAVLGGAVGMASLAAVVLAVWRAPSAVDAALSFDERFNLKERVTTSLTLAPQDVTSAAAQALLADVNQRVEPLRVGDRFPVRVPWTAAFVPLGAAALVLLAFFYNPLANQAQADGKQPLATAADAKAEIDQKMKQLQKKAAVKPGEERPKSPELERLEAELDRLARQPHETKDQAREVVKEMGDVEEQMKKREKEIAERADALREQLKQAERMSKKKDEKDGPANNLDKAVRQGDFERARDEADRLRKKLQQEEKADELRKKLQDEKLNQEEKEKIQEELKQMEDKKLSREDREKLQDQLKDMEDKLQRLSRKKEEKEQELKDLADKGEIDRDQLQRELDRLNDDAEKLGEKDLQDLKELAQKLGECQKCMQEGNDGEAAKKLGEAGEKLAQLDKNGEARQLARKLAELEQARRVMCQALDGNNPASGRRPEGKPHDTQHQDERAPSDVDKGRLNVIDHVPGGGFKGPRLPAEMQEDIRRASQEAPEAIERQRLPRSASDMAKGYFENLRGRDKDK